MPGPELLTTLIVRMELISQGNDRLDFKNFCWNSSGWLKVMMAKHHHVAVIGLGRLGSALAVELSNRGFVVTGIDWQAKAVASVREWLGTSVVADICSKGIIEELGLRKFNFVLICAGSALLPYLIVANALYPEYLERLYYRPLNEAHRTLMEQIGVEHVMEADSLAATQVADMLLQFQKA